MKEGKLIEVAHFEDVCDWPNFTDANVRMLNVENIPQLRNPNKLIVRCEATDVTFKKETRNCSPKPDTIQNNQLANPTAKFYFQPLYDSKKSYIA